MRRFMVILGLLIAAAVGFVVYKQQSPEPAAQNGERIVINEAVRTLLYLPLYHAERRGYFKNEGVDVAIVTGGTATNSIAAVISGDADIAQADPMYAAISQESGSDIVVIGQIVGRIGLWAIERPGTNVPFDAAGVRGKAIITHPKPMTAYTYTTLLLEQWKVDTDDVRIIQAKGGTEVATYQAERSAPFLVGVEPAISILEGQGARVVYSWPKTLGDRTFTGLMVRRAALSNRGHIFRGVLRAYQRSLDDIRRSDPEVLRTAQTYFPNLDRAVIQRALTRLTTEDVFPQSLMVPPASWSSAIAARRQIGDIKGAGEYKANVAAEFTASALK